MKKTEAIDKVKKMIKEGLKEEDNLSSGERYMKNMMKNTNKKAESTFLNSARVLLKDLIDKGYDPPDILNYLVKTLKDEL